MKNIYLPKIDYACYVVVDKDTIRGYYITPYNPTYSNNVEIYYTDYYVNSHYLEKEGSQFFGYNTKLPDCLDKSLLTTDYIYRNDFFEIAIIFMFIFIVVFLIPLKVVIRFFRRFQ